jgi:integrase
MRWKDPISGKFRKVTLDLVRYPNGAARVKVAYRKSIEIQAMRLDKREGVISMPIRDALKRFVAEHRRTLRPRTIADYERIGEMFVLWCEGQGIAFARELTRAGLAAFRTSRVTLPNSRDDELRSPVSVNVELRAVHSLIVAWSRYEWTPELTRDAISDALRLCPVPSEEIEFLRPAKCRLVLRTALEHDRECFKETRREHAGKKEVGTTPRYAPIAPFVAVVMLSGMRRGEAIELTWGDVDLDDKILRLRATATKTKRARRFDMGALSPRLFELLRALYLEASTRRTPRTPPSPGARVFSNLTVDTVESTRRRMLEADAERFAIERIGAWSWQALRRTCATAIANMPGAGPWAESKALGHSVVVSERLYADRMRVDDKANTVEKVLGVEKETAAIWQAIAARPERRSTRPPPT